MFCLPRDGRSMTSLRNADGIDIWSHDRKAQVSPAGSHGNACAPVATTDLFESWVHQRPRGVAGSTSRFIECIGCHVNRD